MIGRGDGKSLHIASSTLTAGSFFARGIFLRIHAQLIIYIGTVQLLTPTTGGDLLTLAPIMVKPLGKKKTCF